MNFYQILSCIINGIRNIEKYDLWKEKEVVESITNMIRDLETVAEKNNKFQMDVVSFYKHKLGTMCTCGYKK